MGTKNVIIALLLFVCFFSANCLGSIINVGPGTSFSPTGSNDQTVYLDRGAHFLQWFFYWLVNYNRAYEAYPQL